MNKKCTKTNAVAASVQKHNASAAKPDEKLIEYM